MNKLFFLVILLFTPTFVFSAPIYLDCNVKEKYVGITGGNYYEDGVLIIKIDKGNIDISSDLYINLFAPVSIKEDSFISSRNFTAKDGSKHSIELEISRVTGKLIASGTVLRSNNSATYYSYSGSCNKASGIKF